MSKIRNYESNIFQLENQYERYSVSRIVETPRDDLLQLEVPTELPSNFFVEMHIYSYANNQLVFSTTTSDLQNNEVFSVTTMQYLQDSSIRRLLFINFSKILQPFPDGRFELVINFFSPEIGNPLTKPVSLTTISPSRTEVELKLTPEYRTPQSASQLRNFALPQINSTWALDAVKYVCNQSQSFNTNIPTDKTALTFDIIQEFLPASESIKLNNPNVAGVYTQSIKVSTQTLLNSIYTNASASIIQYPTETRFTNQLLMNILSSSISRAITEQINAEQPFTLT